MPDKLMVKLTYVTRDAYSLAATDAAVLVLRGNGPFDPENAVGGSQPLGYDQWSAFYARQRTFASKVVVTFQNLTNDAVGYVGVIPSVDVYTPTTIISRDVLTQPYVQWKYISPLGGSRDNVKFRGYMTAAKMFGDRKVAADDDSQSVVGAVPSNQWYWNMFLGSQLATDTMTVESIVKITYYIQFFNRVAMAPS